jgi:TRAP-type C4-dicarboxylate transport system permease small subunit
MLKRFCDALARVTAAVSVACLLVMTVSIMINVFYRYVLNAPLAWPPELARFMMVAVTLLASSLAMRTGAHVGVSIVVLRLPIRVQAWLFTVNSLLILGFLLILLWYGWQLAFNEGPRQMAPSLGVSMMFAFIPLPLGALLMIIHLAETTLEAWQRAARGLSPFEAAYHDEAAAAAERPAGG